LNQKINVLKNILIALLTIFSIQLTAQKVSYNDGIIQQDGEEVKTVNVILSPKVETIEDKFEEWMSKNYDVDLDGKKLLFFDKEFMTANGVIIPQISSKKIDLKVKVSETKTKDTKLFVFASYGYNNWITPEDHPTAYAALKRIVQNFISEYLPKYYYDKVENTEENIVELKDDRSNLNEDIVENQNEIEKLKKDNIELKRKLKENENNIEDAQKKLSERKKEYKAIKKRVSNN